MKEQYIAKYFEYRYYADFVLPIAILVGLLILWLVYIISLYCARKYEEREKKRADKYYAMIKVEEGTKIAEPKIIQCKDCKWFGKLGCAIHIVDDTDKPKETDFCSFAERAEEE